MRECNAIVSEVVEVCVGAGESIIALGLRVHRRRY